MAKSKRVKLGKYQVVRRVQEAELEEVSANYLQATQFCESVKSACHEVERSVNTLEEGLRATTLVDNVLSIPDLQNQRLYLSEQINMLASKRQQEKQAREAEDEVLARLNCKNQRLQLTERLLKRKKRKVSEELQRKSAVLEDEMWLQKRNAGYE